MLAGSHIMSMNGESLADWQTVIEKLNERIQARGGMSYAAGYMLIPVPTSKTHITSDFASFISRVFLQTFFDNGLFVNPSQPWAIIDPSSPYWDPNYQTGRSIYGPFNWNLYYESFDSQAIYATLPDLGAAPLRASELAKLGLFLDTCNTALNLLTKAAAKNVSEDLEVHRAAFTWNPNTGEISNSNTYVLVGTAATFADFYAFALANTTTTTETGDPQCYIYIYNNGTNVSISLEYSRVRIQTTPGGIHADLTLYYTSVGDNCGIAVNTTSTHLDFDTVSYQNVGQETQIYLGFDASNVSTVPTMPTAGNSYTKQENLYNIHAVWDFSNYFQH